MTKDVESGCFSTPEGVREQKNLGYADLEVAVTLLLTRTLVSFSARFYLLLH